MTIYRAKVERTTGKSKGKIEFLVLRANVDGTVTAPRGYKIVSLESSAA